MIARPHNHLGSLTIGYVRYGFKVQQGEAFTTRVRRAKRRKILPHLIYQNVVERFVQDEIGGLLVVEVHPGDRPRHRLCLRLLLGDDEQFLHSVEHFSPAWPVKISSLTHSRPHAVVHSSWTRVPPSLLLVFRVCFGAAGGYVECDRCGSIHDGRVQRDRSKAGIDVGVLAEGSGPRRRWRGGGDATDVRILIRT